MLENENPPPGGWHRQLKSVHLYVCWVLHSFSKSLLTSKCKALILTADSTMQHQSVWGRKGRRRERSLAANINPQAQHNHSSNCHRLLFTLDMDFHCISSSYQSQELGLLLSPSGGCQIWGWVRLTNCLWLHGQQAVEPGWSLAGLTPVPATRSLRHHSPCSPGGSTNPCGGQLSTVSNPCGQHGSFGSLTALRGDQETTVEVLGAPGGLFLPIVFIPRLQGRVQGGVSKSVSWN